MSKIYINDLSKKLRDYFNNLGLTEEYTQQILDEWLAMNELDETSRNGKLVVSSINDINENVKNFDMSDYQKSNSELLDTEVKSIVGAINEIFNLKDTIKEQLVATLLNIGLSVSTNMTFNELMDNVDESSKIGPYGTATASDVLTGKTFINSTGQLITGNIPKKGSVTITPGTTNQTIPTGYYDSVVIKGDSNLKAENIKYGVSIFNVRGTVRTEQTVSISGSGSYQRTVSHNLGKTPSSYSVTVSKFNVSWYATEATYYYTASGLPITFTSSSKSVTISRGDHSTTANIRISFTSSQVTMTFGHGLAQDDESDVDVSVSITLYR